MNERGINWTIWFLWLKTKKGLEIKSLSQKVYIIRHDVAEYPPSENEYISLSGEYLIITEFNTR